VIRLRKEIPSDRCVVAESGIYTSNDVAKLASEDIQAMLVGESLMRQEDIDLAVRQLLSPNSVSK
jgi:indole-3-glycerol phosphate synthase